MILSASVMDVSTLPVLLASDAIVWPAQPPGMRGRIEWAVEGGKELADGGGVQ